MWARHRIQVESQAVEIARLGYIPIVPILLGNENGHLGWAESVNLDYSLVQLANAVFVHVSRWSSKGVEQEVKWARSLKHPVCFTLTELDSELSEMRDTADLIEMMAE